MNKYLAGLFATMMMLSTYSFADTDAESDSGEVAVVEEQKQTPEAE